MNWTLEGFPADKSPGIPQELVKWESLPLPLAEGKSGSPLTIPVAAAISISKPTLASWLLHTLFTRAHYTFQSPLTAVGLCGEWPALPCLFSHNFLHSQY